MFKILADIGEKFNASNILWGVGGSIMLNSYGLIDEPRDIDIIVDLKDADRADRILKKLGEKKEGKENSSYSTKYFYEYIVEGIHIDLMGAFAIKHSEGVYQYPFDRESITKTQEIQGVEIPFTSLEDWYIIYQLIPGRESKVNLIKKYLHSNGSENLKLFKRALEGNLNLKVRNRVEGIMDKLSKGSKKPENLDEIQKSFAIQAENFEKNTMNFSKKEFLDYTVKAMEPRKNDMVFEAAAGTAACGRSIAPFVHSVTCLDATEEMLKIGKRKAEKDKLSNMTFLQGLVEEIPFLDRSFDLVVSRLGFHHFVDIERAFLEMSRVLKKSGKLIIIDMEAAPEELRKRQDRIEAMRDESHVKNIGQKEFIDLYRKNNFTIIKNETTKISVSLDAWMDLTKTPSSIRDEITKKMQDDIDGKEKTGFQPYLLEGKIYFWQRWMLIIGEKGVDYKETAGQQS